MVDLQIELIVKDFMLNMSFIWGPSPTFNIFTKSTKRRLMGGRANVDFKG